MRIAVFGATGRVGREIVRQALTDGHEVTGLVRQATDAEAGMRVIEGNAKNAANITRTIKGADAVVSALGTDRTTTLSEAVPLMIQAMKANGIQRIVTIGTAGILDSRQTPGELRFRGGDSKRRSVFAAEEHEKVFRLLAQSDLDWTIVCPTYLPDGKARGNYRVEADFLPENGTEITVGDTAVFAYNELFEKQFVQKRVGLAY